MKKIIPRAKKYNLYSRHDSWKFMLIGNVDAKLNKKFKRDPRDKSAHLVDLIPYILVGQRILNSDSFCRIIGEPEPIREPEFDDWDSDFFEDEDEEW